MPEGEKMVVWAFIDKLYEERKKEARDMERAQARGRR